MKHQLDNETGEDNNNCEKWVRNAAMTNFGPIIHTVYQKAPDNKVLLAAIASTCDKFYDLEVLKNEKFKGDIADSFMTNDDTERIKEMWAYHLPCVLLVNMKRDYWKSLKPIYLEIYTDISIKVRKSLVASLYEVAKIHLDEPFVIQIATQFVQTDVEELKNRLTTDLVKIIKLFQIDK